MSYGIGIYTGGGELLDVWNYQVFQYMDSFVVSGGTSGSKTFDLPSGRELVATHFNYSWTGSNMYWYDLTVSGNRVSWSPRAYPIDGSYSNCPATYIYVATRAA